MADHGRARPPRGLPAQITESLVSLWTRYAGERPKDARTEIRGNVVTCMLVDAVSDYDKRIVARPAGDVGDIGELTPVTYRRDAIAAVARLTRQRVASLVSSHDADTDVATEVFTLEPSLGRGSPGRADRRRGYRSSALLRRARAAREGLGV